MSFTITYVYMWSCISVNIVYDLNLLKYLSHQANFVFQLIVSVLCLTHPNIIC
jgi:hypothetical protein